jgi:peptide/nickel transport system substrate-binding protein
MPKTFVYALDGPPHSTDPAQAVSVREDRLNWLRFDALINTSKNGKGIEPGLAVKCVEAKGGKEVTVELRSDVLFHDETSLDAAAVKDSFERYMKADPVSPRGRMLQGLISPTGIKVLDDNKIQFTFKYPGLHRLCDIEIVKQADPSSTYKPQDGLVGTGPFKLKSMMPGPPQEIILTKFAGWQGVPNIDEVVFRVVPDGKTQAGELFAGNIHFLPAVTDPAELKRILGSPGLVQSRKIRGLNVCYAGFLTNRLPFKDKNLRLAVAHAINVPRLPRLGSGATRASVGPLPGNTKYCDRKVTQMPHDRAISERLLRQVRRALGAHSVTIGLMYNRGMDLHVQIAGAIQKDLGRVGITVVLKPQDTFPDLVRELKKKNPDGDLFIYTWHVRQPDPERFLTPLFHSRYLGSSNLTRYKNPKVNKMLDDALTLPTGPKKQAKYSAIQREIVKGAPAVFLHHATRVAAFSKSVLGLNLKDDCMPTDKLVNVDI